MCVPSTDMLSQLHLHPVHGYTSQQGVLLRGQPHERSDRADAAELRDVTGTHLHAPAGPFYSAAQSVAGQLSVSVLPANSACCVSVGLITYRPYILSSFLFWSCCKDSVT